MRGPVKTSDRKAKLDEFRDIAPYDDSAVQPVLQRLLDADDIIGAIASFRFPVLFKIAPGIVRAMVRRYLRARIRNLHTVRDFQGALEPLFDQLVARTTDGFSYSGTDALDPDTGYLYISNHRDIALDSGLLNYALWRSGHDTVRIAIGDNLFGRDDVNDVMRLNKGFVVERGASGAKAMFAAFARTSGYIRQSVESGQSVWIAQREGRAKDGFDRTEPALIKMLQMSGRKRGAAEDAAGNGAGHDSEGDSEGVKPRKKESLTETINALHIVPVSISYELDPCGPMKAHELAVRETSGDYEKQPDEDLRSIVTGISGQKGRVHYHFGAPLSGEFESADAVAEYLDSVIVGNYRLWPTHWHAWDQVEADRPDFGDAKISDNPDALRIFKQMLAHAPEQEQAWLLAIYANAIRNRLQRSDSVAAVAQTNQA